MSAAGGEGDVNLMAVIVLRFKTVSLMVTW